MTAEQMTVNQREEPLGGARGARLVLLDVPALERAFEDTMNEARHYLNLLTGSVTVLPHGVTDSATFTAFDRDEQHLLIEPATKRQQYRWMQEYISALEDLDLAARLKDAAVGRGAFTRFKSVLHHRRRERRAWHAFRLDRLRAAIAAWLTAHGILVTAPFVAIDQALESRRQRLTYAALVLGARDLAALVAVARFLAAAADVSERAVKPAWRHPLSAGEP